MGNIRIENDKIVYTNSDWKCERIFEIVNEIPKGYKIWFVSILNKAGYLPLCKVIKGTYNVEIDTLKCIKADGVEEILHAVGYGYNTIKKFERYLLRNKQDYTTKILKEALPYMKQLRYEK